MLPYIKSLQLATYLFNDSNPQLLQSIEVTPVKATNYIQDSMTYLSLIHNRLFICDLLAFLAMNTHMGYRTCIPIDPHIMETIIHQMEWTILEV